MAEPARVPSPASTIDFLHLLQNLKTTPRTGWVRSGVDKPESIADHMYRMSALSLLVQGTEFDYQKCMKLSLVHDIAEAIVGDIAPSDNVSDEDKHAREATAIQQIKEMLGVSTSAAAEIESLWYEYEGCQSKEAALVKDFDKLEMILQAHEYETSQGLSLPSFFESTAGKWRTEYGKALAEEVVRRRGERSHGQVE